MRLFLKDMKEIGYIYKAILKQSCVISKKMNIHTLFLWLIYCKSCYGDPNPVINIGKEIRNAQKYPSPFAKSPLLPFLIASLATQKHTPLTRTRFRKEYDYIIVGAGAGGSVVANRLSEDRKSRVLLLEAGADPPLLSDIPAIPRSFIGSELDWKYTTVPQKYTAKGMVNRQIPLPSGKVLGGSSILNALLYLRGNPKNFDDWAAGGATGWSFQDVYPYFLKSENNTNPDIATNGNHSTGGPLTVSRSEDDPPLKKAMREAGVMMGYEFVEANGPRDIGFNDFQGTVRHGQRCSAAKAFLVPAEKRRNLDIVSEALVTKIVIKDKRAVAVQFNFGGRAHEVKAEREIILSAGTVASAQLLMLSGIGPKDHLESFGIPVVANLPVGQNLQDHVGVFTNFELSSKFTPYPVRLGQSQNIFRYATLRKGPLTLFEGITNTALLRDNRDSSSERAPPNYKVYILEPSPIASKDSALQFGMKEEVFQQTFAPYENTTNYACYVEIFDPVSRGSISLNTTNINDQPLINPQYFLNEMDVDNMVAGLKTCIALGESEPLQKLGSKMFTTVYPGCENLEGDKYLVCSVRTFVNPAGHYTGTCKMGDPKDETTVVDPQLRVKGITGLRVVDASIMPIIVTANTQAAVYMIGEKASDMIKGKCTSRC